MTDQSHNPPLPPELPAQRRVPPARRSGFGGFLLGLGRGINITRLIIINLVFFLLLFLLIGGLYMGGSTARNLENGTVLVIDPEGQLVEQYTDPVARALSGLTGQRPKQVQVRDLVGVIDAAAKDPKIGRILLEPDQLHAGGFAALREVGAALDRFRAAGKPVIAWGAGMDQGQYYLAAHADRVLLDPQGGVMITGLANYRLFYKDLLDKLGVDVHLFRVGQFKSAAEPFILDHASPESKEADSFWLGGLWSSWIGDVAALRKIDPAALRADVDELPQRIEAAHGNLAQLALEQRMIDGLATPAEIDAMMRHDGVPAGKRDQGFRQVGYEAYGAAMADTNLLAPGVTVVVAEGEIVGGKEANGSIGGESTAALIRAARNDRRTKALVLRVNSPGGEVYAAEQIRREVELTRESGIPVVVSMGDMAASGGYWISMNAGRIFAEPNTITGSIGIFGMFYTVPDTLQKIGVRSDGVATGPMAGAFDVTRALDPKVGQVVQSIIDKGYRDFVGSVAKARGKDFASIDAIAQGRVWTGQQALDRGLVDQLGGLNDAVRYAANEAKLGKDFHVRYAEQPMGSFQRFLVNFGDSASVRVARSAGLSLPSWLAMVPQLAPELKLFSQAQPGRPLVYAYCFCAPR
jgi:protease-4